MLLKEVEKKGEWIYKFVEKKLSLHRVISIDEVRIWYAALSESRLLSNMYNCIDTTDNAAIGLVAYYPFEKRGTVYGVETQVPTLEDMAPRAVGGDGQVLMLTPLGTYEKLTFAPPLKNAPVESRLIASPVASERKIVVRLEEGAGITARDVEGTTLNITIDQIHDMHGNESLPIRWQPPGMVLPAGHLPGHHQAHRAGYLPLPSRQESPAGRKRKKVVIK